MLAGEVAQPSRLLAWKATGPVALPPLKEARQIGDLVLHFRLVLHGGPHLLDEAGKSDLAEGRALAVIGRMTAIAERLDRKLKTLPSAAAASVEKLVSDVLEVVEAAPMTGADRAAAIQAHREHVDKCLSMSAGMDWSDFERPDQGVSETREDW